MRTFVTAIVTISTVVLAGVVADRALAASLCVGSGNGCYATIQAAVDAAHNGDTITVRPGTYAGGIVIDKTLHLKGAGRDTTAISGGGPVITIGVAGAIGEPTVSITGVTIRDGVFVGDTMVAFGGGILIPAAANGATGATVAVTDSAITDNHATPTIAQPGGAPCPGGPCPFARGDGGGIENWGDLTLLRTRVSGNEAGGPVASDAHGGGIWSAGVGTLTLKNSAVIGNRSMVRVPNGRFSIGGGVHIQNGGGLTIDNSVIDENTAAISSTFPTGVDMLSNGGGIHVGDDSTVTIDNTRIDRNAVVLDTPNADASGFDAGMIVGASALVLRSSTVSDNRVVANVGSSADSGPSGSALEFDGTATISNTRITGNTATVTSQAGTAASAGAVAAFAPEAALISNSVISSNVQSASSTTGPATVQGNGIVNNGALKLRNDQINDNAGTATGPTGFAHGGGIWNGLLFNPPSVLTLVNTVVTRNTLSASAGLTVQGGGLFTEFPVILDNSRIEKNTPDDCFGC